MSGVPNDETGAARAPRRGVEPTWYPTRLGDRALVLALRGTYVVVYVPFRIVQVVLGWAKVDWALLDLLSLPGLVFRGVGALGGARGRRWGDRANALEHTHLVCRLCPPKRRALRDPEGRGVCAWNRRWNEGDFTIPANFGVKPFLTQYAGHTDLRDFADLANPAPPDVREPGAPAPGRRPSRALGAASAALWTLVGGAVFVTTCAGGFLTGRPDRLAAADWTTLAPVPEAERRYPPQGLVAVGDRLLFTNHWKDERSVLYRLDPATMGVLDEAALPAEATHTSGLAWDGEHLWTVDYAVGKVYRIDVERTFADGEAHVLGAWDTGLGGASANTIVTVDGTRYLAVSDFLNSRRTYLIRLADVPALAGDLPDRAWIAYDNGGFSQGLVWDGTYLYEAENNVGVDRIELLDVAEAVRQRDASLVRRLGSVSAPAPAVEDLAVLDGHLWTSDEETYRFYRIPMARVLPTDE